jgi:hypothetical protein
MEERAEAWFSGKRKRRHPVFIAFNDTAKTAITLPSVGASQSSDHKEIPILQSLFLGVAVRWWIVEYSRKKMVSRSVNGGAATRSWRAVAKSLSAMRVWRSLASWAWRSWSRHAIGVSRLSQAAAAGSGSISRSEMWLRRRFLRREAAVSGWTAFSLLPVEIVDR